MPGITINLTEEQFKAAEKMYDTNDLQDTMQKNVEVGIDNYIRDQYKRALTRKSLEELKALVPDLKIEKEPEPELEPVEEKEKEKEKEPEPEPVEEKEKEKEKEVE